MNNKNKLLSSTIYIIIFSLIGKILGFLRESLIAAQFGATMELDVFQLSQTAIAMVSSVITASIATTFIPVLQKVENVKGENSKKIFTNNMISIVSILSIFLMVTVYFSAPQITMLFTFNHTYNGFDLMQTLLILSIPTILFSALAGIFTGYLQYNGKFAIVGAIAIPANILNILYLIYSSNNSSIRGLTVISTVSVLIQFIFLLPSAFRSGYRIIPVCDFRDKYVKQAVILSAPVFISSSVDNINQIVNRAIALKMGEGSVVILNCANKMNTMIIGIFIMAITAVIFPVMSRSFGSNDIRKGKRVMNASINLVLLLTIPATIGLFILAKPIIDIAFLHGKFTEQNAMLTTSTLRFYSISLISLSIIAVLNRVYYSLSDTKTPFIVGVINVILNISINILFAHRYGTKGLAAALSFSTTIAAIILFIVLRIKIGSLGTKSYIRTFIKSSIASSFMGLFASVYYLMEYFIKFDTTKIKFITLIVIIFVSSLIYFTILYMLKVKEAKEFIYYIKKYIYSKSSLC